jgi:hypothetical protein
LGVLFALVEDFKLLRKKKSEKKKRQRRRKKIIQKLVLVFSVSLLIGDFVCA